MENRYKIYMLPTDVAKIDLPVGKPQNVFITDTKDKVDIGDWFLVYLYDKDHNKVLHLEKCETINDLWVNDKIYSTTRHINNCQKIIASTDDNLNLPTIHSSLIERFVDERFEYVPENYICSPEQLEKLFDEIDSEVKEKAFEWWNSLRNTRLMNGTFDKGYYTDNYFGFNSRMYQYLTGKEIIKIYKKFN